MTAIVLGSCIGRTVDNPPALLDLSVLLRSSMLVQSNSGGGKSWALRRIAEQASPFVQTIIIDPEGEFSSLRARFPFVLIGPGGDAPATVAGARLTALRLLELRTSAVCDLFDLPPPMRREWVGAFVDAITEAPKTLWHEAIVMLDEAHQFAPEKADTPASQALATAASVWRKRGKCLIAATQRLAKFNKDVAAELQNKLIGPTFMDIDRERAAEELGVGRKEKGDFYQQIKTLPPGTFFALGRAISTERILVKTGAVESVHPEADVKRHLEPPPAPDKIRHLLPQLVDLPKEVTAKLKTESDLRVEVARLRAQIAAGPVSISQAIDAETVKWRERGEAAEAALREFRREFDGATPTELRRLRDIETTFTEIAASVDGYRAHGGRPRLSVQPVPILVPPDLKAKVENILDADTATAENASGRMLRALATAPAGVLRKRQLATLSTIARHRSTFRVALGKLARAGYAQAVNDDVSITPEGRRVAGVVKVKEAAEIRAIWRGKLTGSARAIFDLFVATRADPAALTKENVATSTGISRQVSTFRVGFGQLVRNDLIERDGRGFRLAKALR